jgi:predicted RNA-binding protein YlxR (DUF448 family)
MALRHVPERTCVACRESKPKRSLVRLVRRTDGSVVVDLTGKQSGRGAYLCQDPACWRVGLRKDALGRALKTTVATIDREALARFAASLSGADPDTRAEVPAGRSES